VDDDETAGGFENLLDGQQLLERGRPIERIVRIESEDRRCSPPAPHVPFSWSSSAASLTFTPLGSSSSRLECDPSSKALFTRFMKKYSSDEEETWDDRCMQIERIIDHDKAVGQVQVNGKLLPTLKALGRPSLIRSSTLTPPKSRLTSTTTPLETLCHPWSCSTRLDRPANADGFHKLEQSPVFNEGYEQGFELRPYQVDGLNWLIFNCMFIERSFRPTNGLGQNCPSSIHDSLPAFHHYNDRGPFSTICPLSAALISPVNSKGSQYVSRTVQGRQCFKGVAASHRVSRPRREWQPVYKDQHGRPIFKFNVLITTYEILRSDISQLRQINWHLVCIDEAHRLKNNDSKTTGSMRELKTEFTLLLTGTPLQNNLEELWTLLNIRDRVRFSSKDEFSAAIWRR